MIRLRKAKFARPESWIQWQRKNQGLFIRIPEDRLSLHVLFFVHKWLNFGHLLNGVTTLVKDVKFPEGINNESLIMDFLLDQKHPKSIEFNFTNGQTRQLRNRACDRDLLIVKNCMNDPKSIYSYMSKYMKGHTSSTDPKYTSHMNYFLNQFYMMLTAKTYCRLNNVKESEIMGQKLKGEILNYIGEEYENHSPVSIKKKQSEKDLIQQKINLTQQQISKIQDEIDKKIKFYKFGAIVVTAAHIVSFGYMTFFVEWLGWDIIEPLTYTVGVFYTLLGIRFYRKYRTDRTGDSLREIISKIVMKPTKLVTLKDLRIRLALQQAQLKRVDTHLRLLKNRINFSTALTDSFNKQNSILTTR